MTKFTIHYPNGEMTLKLEEAFKLDTKQQLVNIYKPQFHKIMKLVNQNCTPQEKEKLWDWFSVNAPSLVSDYTKNFARNIKGGKTK